MAGTNARLAKKALIEQLAALPALADVTVVYGQGEANDQPNELIYGGKASSATQEYATLRGGARMKRDERLLIALVVYVLLLGTEEQAEDRATAIGQVVEEYIADNPTLQYAVGTLNYVGVAQVDLDSDALDDGQAEAHLTFHVAVRSRLD